MHVREHVDDATHIPVTLFISRDDNLVCGNKQISTTPRGGRDCKECKQCRIWTDAVSDGEEVHAEYECDICLFTRKPHRASLKSSLPQQWLKISSYEWNKQSRLSGRQRQFRKQTQFGHFQYGGFNCVTVAILVLSQWLLPNIWWRTSHHHPSHHIEHCFISHQRVSQSHSHSKIINNTICDAHRGRLLPKVWSLLLWTLRINGSWRDRLHRHQSALIQSWNHVVINPLLRLF